MKARILVIEDEMSINDLLCMNLEIAGYETVGYLDGNEAYEAIIQDHAFQCALVDITDVIEKSHLLFFQTGGFTLSLIVVMGIILYLSLRKITAPLTSLREATLLVSEGIYDFKVPSEGNTELAQVGATFNFMTAVLKEKHLKARTMTVQSQRQPSGISLMLLKIIKAMWKMTVPSSW